MAPQGGGAKLGGALPNLHILCPKTAFFGPKRHRNPLNTAKRREAIATLHVRLHCPVTKSSLLASNSTICPRNGPKMATSGLNVRHLCQTSPKPRTGRILGYVAQNRIPRAPSPPATPRLFVVSKPQIRPTRRLDPRTGAHLVEPESSAARAWSGPTVCPPGSPGPKKIIFSKVVPRRLGMLKQVFLAHFEPVVTRFGPWKIPKCLENGALWAQNWVKNGSKTRFSKSDRGLFGMPGQVLFCPF